MRAIKGFFSGLVLCLLSVSFLQQQVPFATEERLHGFFRLSQNPDLSFFTWHRWFSGEFQEAITKQTEDHTGFRNSLIRIRNEYEYRLFGIGHAQGFIRGKQRVLFEEDYILEYTGKFFIGEKTIRLKMEKLKAVQEELEKQGTRFLLVFEPGKASFMPEYIPDHFHPERRTISNYTVYTREALRLGIPTMNLNDYFLSIKDTSRYKLFPDYGMHWSIYGAGIAMDTIKRYLETTCGTPLPEMITQDILLSDSLIWTDKDIADLLNLIYPLPKTTMAYPVIRFDTTFVKPRLSVLVVADSYYINLINDFTPHLYLKEEFWYYNSKLYPHISDNREPVYVEKSNLTEKFREFDVVMLMVSEINLHCGFWNFADEAYQAFFPAHSDPPWYQYENKIRNSREWFRFMAKKAKKNQTSLEKAILRDAKYLYKTENP